MLGRTSAWYFTTLSRFAGIRAVDLLRRQVQLRTMRRMLRAAEVAIFTVPLNVVSWRGSAGNSTFIPVGANLPEVRDDPGIDGGTQFFGADRIARRTDRCVRDHRRRGRRQKSAHQIAGAIRFAVERGAKLQLHAFGRGAAERETELRDRLKDVPVALRVDGLMPADRVGAAIRGDGRDTFRARCDFDATWKRDSGNRVRQTGDRVQGTGHKASPITEAGVVLVEQGNSAELGEALLRVATDRGFRDSLSERSARAQEMFFSWDAIAGRYIEAMDIEA